MQTKKTKTLSEVELTVETVEQEFIRNGLSEPAVAKWAGRCYEIACAMLEFEMLEGTPRYGHWLGPVALGTLFDRSDPDAPIHHGWIELPDGRICDPTRWVFEADKPYIFVGHDIDGFYDIGGDERRDTHVAEKPVRDKLLANIKMKRSDPARIFVEREFGKGPYSTVELFWLANLSRARLGQHAKAVYQWIEKAGHRGYIPIDNARFFGLVEEKIEKRKKKRGAKARTFVLPAVSVARRCFHCGGSGQCCNICGESSGACECGDAYEMMICPACEGS